MKSLVIIPTYTARDNLARLPSQVLSQESGLDVLVIYDSSPDGTGAVGDELATAQPRIRVLHCAWKQGLGTTDVIGFEYALRAGYEDFVQMDADFSYRPADLPRLLDGLRSADVVIGSGNVPDGHVIGWPWSRKLMSRAGSLYPRLLLGLPVRDCTGRFKSFHRGALDSMDLERLRSDGYGFQVEVHHSCRHAGTRLTEVPIVFSDRVQGKSQMSAQIVLEAAAVVIGLWLGMIPPAVAASARRRQAAA